MIVDRYHSQLRRLQERRAAFESELHREFTRARKAGLDSNAIDYETHDSRLNIDLIDYEISELRTSHLIRLAQRRHVPLPQDADAWEPNKLSGGQILTDSAAHALQAEIRREQREAAELTFRWIPSITGLIGTIIGLAALTWQIWQAGHHVCK